MSDMCWKMEEEKVNTDRDLRIPKKKFVTSKKKNTVISKDIYRKETGVALCS